MKLYMFRTVPLSIIRSLFTVHSVTVYVIQVCRQLSSRTRMELFLIVVLSSGLSLLLSCGLSWLLCWALVFLFCLSCRHMNVKLDLLVSQLLKQQRLKTVELLSLITYEHVFYVISTFFGGDYKVYHNTRADWQVLPPLK